MKIGDVFKSHIISDIISGVVYDTMAEQVWKCYKCDLTFKKGELASVHTDISGHPLVQMK